MLVEEAMQPRSTVGPLVEVPNTIRKRLEVIRMGITAALITVVRMKEDRNLVRPILLPLLELQTMETMDKEVHQANIRELTEVVHSLESK